MNLNEGQLYEIAVEYTNQSSFSDRKPDQLHGGALQIGACRVVEDADLIKEACLVASHADIAILCLGTDGERESEGFDRQSMR
jgi:beta-glucosidase